MTDLLAHDVLRGAVSPFRRSPRGLDRVDLDISGHLHEHWRGEMVGVLALPWGLRYFDRARIAAGRDAILRDWAETPAHDAENTGDILRVRGKGVPNERGKRGEIAKPLSAMAMAGSNSFAHDNLPCCLCSSSIMRTTPGIEPTSSVRFLPSTMKTG